MAIATMTMRVKALRRTKFYDLVAAGPLIAWYLFCAANMLPSLGDQLALIKLFIRTDSSVLPATLVLSTISHISTLVFFVVLVVMFAVRHVSQSDARGFYPRFAAVAGTSLSVGFVLLPQQELSYALYVVSLLLIIAGTGFAIYAVLVLGRSISILPEARRLVARGPYALVRHPLYLGELVALTGVALQYMSVSALLLLALVWSFQLQRMKYEEQVLFQTFPGYGDYMAGTARLLPGIY
ncbi:methyltransferase family protein [Bradyrhizobium erythrophlei]|uniref:Protein-S-isoprenylcysteine O-methyltransferase Ste14 n=1 Tax=Bradyrhizobium erythrophlei TaxID=1437360 RepID=A0A1M7UXQ0_9BRAD|nr:methyltransferase [Bradyrhizobium erythrophlei]SHN87811.1 Protein-S-isoprenylcysteine O-methyltransferase Ste14 [Bradyrhizobium erythrophlei]